MHGKIQKEISFWLRKQLTKAKQRAQCDFNDYDDNSTDKMPFTLNP